MRGRCPAVCAPSPPHQNPRNLWVGLVLWVLWRRQGEDGLQWTQAVTTEWEGELHTQGLPQASSMTLGFRRGEGSLLTLPSPVHAQFRGRKWVGWAQELLILSVSSLGFPGGSLVKWSTCQGRWLRFDPWMGKIPWRRKWQPTPASLPGKSHWQRSLAGCNPKVAKSWTQQSDLACMHACLTSPGDIASWLPWISNIIPCLDNVCPPWDGREGRGHNSVGNEHSTLGARTTLLPPQVGLKLVSYLLLGVHAFWLQREGITLEFIWLITSVISVF